MSATEQPLVPQARAAWDYFEAVEASRKAQEAQIAHEKARAEAAEQAAAKEREYRKALATKIMEIVGEGKPATVAQDLARGDDHVAQLRYERDVAVGVKEVMEQAAWRHTANRKDVQNFTEWSQKVAPLGEQQEAQ